jgi:hypothetical protein
MSTTTIQKAEVIITIDSAEQYSIDDVKLINFPLSTNNTDNVSIKYSPDSGNIKIYKSSIDNNVSKDDKYSQITIKNLHPLFNPLQVTLVAKSYDPNFSGNSIFFVDAFSSGSGSEIYLDKKQNTLTFNNFISMIRMNNTNITNQFNKANQNGGRQPHLIAKIIILYDMSYVW